MAGSVKIFLVGYSGCGKTTLGRKAAKRLNVRFIDTDTAIEEMEQASVSDIFRYGGEDYFRNTERKVLEMISDSCEPAIISTGGGLPVWRDNAELLNTMGVTVYISRPAEQIARRLSPYGRAKRPRLRGLGDAELVEFMERDIAAREPFYGKAHRRLDGGRHNDEELLGQLVKIFRDEDEQ